MEKIIYNSNTDLFKKMTTKEFISQVYIKYIYFSFAIGVDNINKEQFNLKLDSEVKLINRKLDSNIYKFSRYKLKLISKGQGKPPRELYIPTIRDRIVLKTIQLYLKEVYGESVEQETPQNIVKKLKDYINSGTYDHYIKIDIKDFYPSIDKEILLKKIRRKIRSQNFNMFLRKAMADKDIRGVPQGLSISNILAYIYLSDLDNELSKTSDIIYLRFVDDIFILLKKNNKDNIIKILNKEFKKIKLSIHNIQSEGSKSKFGKVSNGLDYLGYVYEDGKFTVRKSTLNNLRNSIIECFTSYKYASSEKKNLEFLIWRLNLKITGCIDDRQPKGWLYFFSQITDKKILHELDYFINKLWRNFGLPIDDFKRVKKFSRAYHEITYNFYESNYIPNFDKYTHAKKVDFLEKVYKFDTKGRDELEIDNYFKTKIRKQVKQLLVDIRNVS
ncbi:reverse transcriptase domain-containing protein [Acinetobacter nosocomialis]|uniref:reverse transcriptase domain-containing protein n=1 Tax=Acinetobacter nosocomialis TaxID=106654 RepID=UPI001ADBCEA2|nr:reverse transcriptase domain-containing protein [Acinetobacter nosocomialis]MBO8210555.1 hypothetical protein [Acinetobacter nosocomialis]MBO8227008.1 hypothetical protein [Acinetobacter nosocomialis]MBO8252412.1 hypothetical protein [Acinetobacter nosocomialis]